jgi:hypothetical protein
MGVSDFQNGFAILLKFKACFSCKREKAALIFCSVILQLITWKLCVILHQGSGKRFEGFEEFELLVELEELTIKLN